MLGLTKEDKEFIKTTIHDELEKALTAYLIREITVEKGPRKQGDPEKIIEKEECNVLDFLCHYLPLIEGSNRGLQSDINKVVNSTGKTNSGIEAIARVLIDSEEMIKKLAFAAYTTNVTDNTTHNHGTMQMDNESKVMISEI